MDEYDIAVLGGGTAGLTAARVARALGKKVVLIEENRLGGECTWDGCIPSKALLAAARLYHDIGRARQFGLRAAEARVDFPAVMAYVRRTTERIGRFESPETLEQSGIEVRDARARFVTPRTLQVGRERIHARRTIICTGSRPAIPKIPGVSEVRYVTNRTFFESEGHPHDVLVLGAGRTGLEIAQALHRLGGQATVIETRPEFLPEEDPDIAARARAILEQEGIVFYLGVGIDGVQMREDVFRLTISPRGSYKILEGDTLFIAAGRQPNLDDLGLEKLGVQTNPHGITVDAQMRTSLDNIFAAGDVTGLYHRSPVAAYQGQIAARNASGQGEEADYRVIPQVIFTDPPIARVGLTEPKARQLYADDVSAVTLPYTAIDRAVIDREIDGVIKVIVGKRPGMVFRRGEGELLGAHIIGPMAGEIIHEFSGAMQSHTPVTAIARAIHAYPTIAAGNQLAAALLSPTGRALIDLRGALESTPRADQSR